MYKDMKDVWSKATTSLSEAEFPAPQAKAAARGDGSSKSASASRSVTDGLELPAVLPGDVPGELPASPTGIRSPVDRSKCALALYKCSRSAAWHALCNHAVI